MSFSLLEKPLFEAGGHYVTLLGLIAFAGFFAAGLVIALRRFSWNPLGR